MGLACMRSIPEKSSKMILQLLLLQLILLLLWLAGPSSAAAPLAKPGCEDMCGNISIPYPFGMGTQNCYHNDWYAISCNHSFNPPKPYLSKYNLEVLGVSLRNRTVLVNNLMISVCNNSVQTAGRALKSTGLVGSPFLIPQEENKLTVMGCGNAFILSKQGRVVAGCSTVCHKEHNYEKDGCYGINCCQTTVPFFVDSYTVNMTWLEANTSNSSTGGGCGSAFFADERWSPTSSSSVGTVPLVLYWTMSEIQDSSNCYSNSMRSRLVNFDNGSSVQSYGCVCNSNREGNAYFLDGCQVPKACSNCPMDCARNHTTYGVPEETYYCPARIRSRSSGKAIILGVSISMGSLLLVTSSFWLYKIVKKIRKKKQKEKFFKQNGGLLLQQQMSADQGGVEKTRVFSARELEKATDHFNENRILGRGSQGTVYKGMLTDGTIVAVKKSKLVDEGQVEQFINEVVILSQINHRNVVKILGCCLETEVPLLVYEYISNGTLSRHIHDENDEFPISWAMRLRIASEVAEALAYLHYATSVPIYHRDIKSTNILLDDKYKAKISDFGTSKSAGIDQTHLTTLVKGTFGYLDPQYFQSSHFTEKSDVYSFGVVLAELLTGRKSIFSNKTGETVGLATYFLEETQIFETVDARVLKEGTKEELEAVADLVKRCLNLNGKRRPTMKEVARELERIKIFHMLPSSSQKNLQQMNQSAKPELNPVELSGCDLTSTEASLESNTTSSNDGQPLGVNSLR